MPSNPRNLRTAREISRRDILFSVARVPNSERLFVASSDTKVHELDASLASPPARELANHGRYVTAVRLAGSTGRQANLIPGCNCRRPRAPRVGGVVSTNACSAWPIPQALV